MENSERPEDKDRLRRKKRVARIKKYIICLLCILLIIPNLISLFVLFRMKDLEKTVSKLENDISAIQFPVDKREVSDAQILTDNPSNEIITEMTSEVNEEEFLTDAERYQGCNLVYLTFDDGPSKYTDTILDILAENEVKATFFVVAKEGHDEQYQRIVTEGHTLGLHSYSHAYDEVYRDTDSFESDVAKLQTFLFGITGQGSRFYRFPGGSSNSIAKDKETMFSYLNRSGLTYFDWNVSSQDASQSRLAATQIVKNVLSGTEGKQVSVVLMHDAADKGTTVEALPVIIEKLKERDDTVFLSITEGTEPIQHVTAEAIID